MTIELPHLRALRGWDEWCRGIVQLDRNSGCLLSRYLVDRINHISVSSVGRQKHETAKAVVDEINSCNDKN